LTLKILWALMIMVSSGCMGAGIRGVIYEASNTNILLFSFGLLGTAMGTILYFLKIVFAVYDTSSPLP
ncbi:MAG: hypothetical protein EBT39_06205, partial [Sphingobacteriia bacterium]|nr:hypothetical protein [Candidatus Fonsibacter lacus]